MMLMMLMMMMMIIIIIIVIVVKMTVIIIIIIMIALKGEFRDILQSPHYAPTRMLEWPGRCHVLTSCKTSGA